MAKFIDLANDGFSVNFDLIVTMEKSLKNDADIEILVLGEDRKRKLGYKDKETRDRVYDALIGKLSH